jgi:hypothetical protein
VVSEAIAVLAGKIRKRSLFAADTVLVFEDKCRSMRANARVAAAGSCVELSHEFDKANEMLVELLKLLCRNPVFAVISSPDVVHLELPHPSSVHVESRHEP